MKTANRKEKQAKSNGLGDAPRSGGEDHGKGARHGQCPYCGKRDGFLNIGPNHWFYCLQHQVTWWGGFNFFPSWRTDDVWTWLKNIESLETFFKKVEPIASGTEIRPFHGHNTNPPTKLLIVHQKIRRCSGAYVIEMWLQGLVFRLETLIVGEDARKRDRSSIHNGCGLEVGLGRRLLRALKPSSQ